MKRRRQLYPPIVMLEPHRLSGLHGRFYMDGCTSSYVRTGTVVNIHTGDWLEIESDDDGERVLIPEARIVMIVEMPTVDHPGPPPEPRVAKEPGTWRQGL